MHRGRTKWVFLGVTNIPNKQISTPTKFSCDGTKVAVSGEYVTTDGINIHTSTHVGLTNGVNIYDTSNWLPSTQGLCHFIIGIVPL